jgi:hypothetical protein
MMSLYWLWLRERLAPREQPLEIVAWASPAHSDRIRLRAMLEGGDEAIQ